MQAQLAEQSSTLLDQHPRIKELRAQIADLERQLRLEADRLARSLENDSKLAEARVASLVTSLESTGFVWSDLSAADHDFTAPVAGDYWFTDGEFVTKRRFFETLADGLGLPRPKSSIPLWLARILARWREAKFRRLNRPYPPRITQGSLKFPGLNLDFAIGKARTVLGYEPKIGFNEGMKTALDWYRTVTPAG